jgi:hypothetical protein
VRYHHKSKAAHQVNLPHKLQSKLFQNIKSLLYNKGEDPYKFLTIELINKIRNQFYSVLLELFTHYSQFVGEDQFGDKTFNVRAFISFGDNKIYKDFYNGFFYANTEK